MPHQLNELHTRTHKVRVTNRPTGAELDALYGPAPVEEEEQKLEPVSMASLGTPTVIHQPPPQPTAPAQPQVDMMKVLDTNGDGILSPQELAQAQKPMAQAQPQVDMMRVLDTNGDGILSPQELAQAQPMQPMLQQPMLQQPVMQQPALQQPVMQQPVYQPQPVLQQAMPAPQPPPMQKMMVPVPIGVGPGHILRVQTPAGLMQVTVPPHAIPGQMFEMMVPGAPPPPPPQPMYAQPPPQPQVQKLSAVAVVPGGQQMQVQTPAGMMNVTVPVGIQPGQTFQFQIQAPAAQQPFNPAFFNPAGMGR